MTGIDLAILVLAMAACAPVLLSRAIPEGIGCVLLVALLIDETRMILPATIGWWRTLCVGRFWAGALSER